MKLVTFEVTLGDNEKPLQRVGALLDDERVIDVSFAARTGVSNARLRTMRGFIRIGPPAIEATMDLITRYADMPAEDAPFIYAMDDVRLLPPLRNPRSLRDFYAFETHVRTANANRGRDVPPEWYEVPVFYFSNHRAVFGPDQPVAVPPGSSALDYELEVAAVLGKGGRNIAAEDAEDHIFGYMIFNDWSARDLQRQEMRVGLGPAKGKDFASSFGPMIVTPDELSDCHTGRPGVYDLDMVARVNGEERSRGSWADLHYDFGQMIARASAGVTLAHGEVIGSGTVGTGCLLELTKGEGPWLQPGDVVELEIERLGVLRTEIHSKEETHA